MTRSRGSESDVVPRRVTDAQLQALPLRPTEGFVLSSVDGRTSAEELADLSGLPLDEVLEILDKLVDLGVVAWTLSQPLSGRPGSQGEGGTASRDPSSPGPRATSRPPAVTSDPPLRPSRPPPFTARRPSHSSFRPPAPGSSEPSTFRRPGAPPRGAAGGPGRSVPPPRPPAPHADGAGAAETGSGAATAGGARTGTTGRPASGGARVSAADGAERRRPTPPPGALYHPDELAEPDVDLDVERRRSILDRYYRLDALDHYALLGVPRDAPKGDVRTAYFTESRKFHPDTLFRKRLGSYKMKMEAVFRELTTAYETLSRAKRRAEYDAYLAARDQTRAATEALAEVQATAEAIERDGPLPGEAAAETAPATGDTPARGDAPAAPDAAPETPRDPPPARGAVASSPSGSAPRSSGAGPGATRDARRRALAAHRIQSMLGARTAGGRPGGGPVGPRPGRASSAPPSDLGRRMVLRGLATSLRQTAELTGGVDQAKRYVDGARAAEERGDYVAASNAIRMAIALAPDREDLEHEHTRLRRIVAAQLADTYERQARYEESHHRWKEAAASWARVCEGRPEDGEARLAAAEAYVEANASLAEAKTHAEAAVALLPASARAFRAAGRIYVALGMQLNARRALQKAHELDPDDRIVNTLLAELRA